jgi:hypothetical protein
VIDPETVIDFPAAASAAAKNPDGATNNPANPTSPQKQPRLNIRADARLNVTWDLPQMRIDVIPRTLALQAGLLPTVTEPHGQWNRPNSGATTTVAP